MLGTVRPQTPEVRRAFPSFLWLLLLGTAGLAENATLTTLSLSGCRVGDEGCIRFADALKRNTVLTTLTLASNQIAAAGLLRLGTVLKEHNTTLHTLRLLGNNVEAKVAVQVGTDRSLGTVGARDSRPSRTARSRTPTPPPVPPCAAPPCGWQVAELLSANEHITGLQIVDALSIGSQTATIKRLCARFPDVSKPTIIAALRDCNWHGGRAAAKVAVEQGAVDEERRRAQQAIEEEQARLAEEKRQRDADAKNPRNILRNILLQAKKLDVRAIVRHSRSRLASR